MATIWSCVAIGQLVAGDLVDDELVIGQVVIEGRFLIGVAALIVDEGIDFGGGWRKANQIETQAAEQCDAIGLGRGRELLTVEAGEDEGVDGIGDPLRIRDRGELGADGRNEGPVFLDGFHLRTWTSLFAFAGRPFGALIDPGFDGRDLGGIERLAAHWHRDEARKPGDALIKRALVGLARDDGLAVFATRKGAGFGVEAQAGHSHLGAMGN